MLPGLAVLAMGSFMAVTAPTYRHVRDFLSVLAFGVLFVIVGAMAMGLELYR